MEDKWIKAFQEKLEDYEWDGAAPASRRRVWLFPALAGAAAAAVLAFLLLRTPGAGKPQEFRNLITEVPTSVIIDQPASPAAIRLARPNRDNSPMGLSQLKSAAIAPVAQTATVEATPDETPTEGIRAEEIPAIEPTDEEGPFVEEGPAETLPEWPEEAPADRKTGISARLHINPLGLSAGTATFLLNAIPHDQINEPEGFPSHLSDLHSSSFTSFYVDNVNEVASNNLLNRIPVQKRYHYYLPVKTGISVRIAGTGAFSLESGLNYDFHRATVYYEGTSTSLTYRMHYLGIPVKLVCAMAEWRRLSFYTTAGGEVEWMVSGRELIRSNEQTVTDQWLQVHPFLFSLTGAAGMEYKFNARLGLYAEPGIAWHFEPQGNLPNYYRDHPLSFDLHLGLRFNLN